MENAEAELRGARRLSLIADQRLQACPAVEVWYGPMCVLRLRRPVARQA
jgi:hypothetical protein